MRPGRSKSALRGYESAVAARAVRGSAVVGWHQRRGTADGQLVSVGGTGVRGRIGACARRCTAAGPLSAYLRDPQVENVDVNGCDQV